MKNQKCTCDTPQKLYSSTFDATYCKLCNLWLEDKCDDIVRCEYCNNRPLFPNDYQPI